MEIGNNNEVTLIGTFEENVCFSHEIYSEKFYQIFLKISRKSRTNDIIPVLVSNRLLDLNDYKGRRVEVTGEYRSYNKQDKDGKSHLILYVFAQNIKEVSEDVRDKNLIVLTGYTCKPVIYRKTYFGREIADVLLAVNREFHHSNYIPCIVWGRNARYAENFPVGTHLKMDGRIQSREYPRQGGIRIAYEVSVSKMEEL